MIPRPPETPLATGHDHLSAGSVTTHVVRGYPESDLERPWREFLGSIPWASHFVAPEYFLEPRLARKQPFAILAKQNGDIVACLTGWHEGVQLVSGSITHPQVAIRDVPDRDVVEAALARALLDEAKHISSLLVYSWERLPGFDQFKFWSRRFSSTYLIDLRLSEEALFAKLDGKRRNGIRRAMKSGVEVRQATGEDLPDFYEVLKPTHARLGLPPPLPIDEILRPATNKKLFIATYHGRCVGGTIIRYQPGGLAEYSENASLADFWNLRPNDLLLWEAVKWAKGAGCTALNLAGHNLFKKEFGGELHPVYRISLDRSFLRRRHTTERLETWARSVYRRFVRRSP